MAIRLIISVLLLVILGGSVSVQYPDREIILSFRNVGAGNIQHDTCLFAVSSDGRWVTTHADGSHTIWSLENWVLCYVRGD